MRLLPLIFILSSITGSVAQNYFTDISLTFGTRYNDNSTGTPENYDNIEYSDRQEKVRYFTMTRKWNSFIALQSSIIEGVIKQQKKDRSLSMKLEGGFYFHRVNRSHHFSSLISNNFNSDSTHYYLYSSEDYLSYSTKSNNIGVSLNIVFVKKWSKIFDFEYGLLYKSDLSFLQVISYDEQPTNDSWRQLEYSKSHNLKNRFSQQINLYFATMFNLNDRFSLGLSFEIPTIIYSLYTTHKSYPIVGTENNYINRNSFFGLKCAYTFNKQE
jgi:hypothetical protein